jgi:hypothetical protein
MHQPTADLRLRCADCARRAGLVGRWLAAVEPALAFNLLGIRP